MSSVIGLRRAGFATQHGSRGQSELRGQIMLFVVFFSKFSEKYLWMPQVTLRR